MSVTGPDMTGAEDPSEGTPGAGAFEEGAGVAEEDAGLDIMVPGVDPGVDGVDPTPRERIEAGLQDSLDLSDWRMPSLGDYFWYVLVYTVLITLAVAVIYRYRMLWAYVLWGGYLVTMLALAALIVRSMNYRRGTYSKGFEMSTLEIQRAIEEALDETGLRLDRMEQDRGAFLRPMIAVYHVRDVGFHVNLEGRTHLKRKVVRVGRFPREADRQSGQRFIEALDGQAERAREGRVSRSLFREEGAY
mgnify:CR=1 FL=1